MILPPPLRTGDVVGVFAPSSPAHVTHAEKYRHGLHVLSTLGFEPIEGSLIRRGTLQGYRSGTPRERAAELMELFRDPKVKAIVSTIGGYNSSSLIPYVDFDEIRANPKVFCGFSDVTSLHLAIHAYAGLRTFYGPAVIPNFAEWPEMLPETRDSFLDAVQRHTAGSRVLHAPARWSNHAREWKVAWKTEPRRFEPNPGWKVLRPGEATAPLLAANLNTLLSAAGTGYFPDLEGKLLLIEQMDAPMAREERLLRHLERLGAFDRIAGLLVGKPEFPDANPPFPYEDLLEEILETRDIPVATGIDCGHTHPTLTIPLGVRATLRATDRVELILEEPSIAS